MPQVPTPGHPLHLPWPYLTSDPTVSCPQETDLRRMEVRLQFSAFPMRLAFRMHPIARRVPEPDAAAGRALGAGTYGVCGPNGKPGGTGSFHRRQVLC